MYYKLNKGLLLRGWKRAPYALVDKNRHKTFFITGAERKALELCNGKINLSLPLIPDSVREMLPLLEKNGVIVPCAKGDAVAPEQEYYCYPARYIRAAHWSVTGRCNYRCKHCYMSAPDAKYGELSHEAVMSIARQLMMLIPAAFLLSRTGVLRAVWWAFPIAEIMGVICTVSFFLHLYKTIIKPLEQ